MKSEKITLAHIMPQKARDLAKITLAPDPSKKSPVNDKKNSREARQLRLVQLKEIRKLLHTTYPTIFDYNDPKPLAIGIHKDIKYAFPRFSQSIIRKFLGKWVKDPRYLTAITNSQSRYNLQGEHVSQVELPQRNYSQKRLDTLSSTK